MSRSRGVEPKSAAEFADEMKATCKRERIDIEPKEGKVVCRDVRLKEPVAMLADA